MALYLAFLLVPGFSVSGSIPQWVLAGIALAVLNMVVRPILKAIAFPLIILTLGLFTLVINAVILWAVDYTFALITIQDVVALVWATIVISAVNLIVSMVAKVI